MRISRRSWHYRLLEKSATWRLGWEPLHPRNHDNFCSYARAVLIVLPLYWAILVLIVPLIGLAFLMVIIYERYKVWEYHRMEKQLVGAVEVSLSEYYRLLSFSKKDETGFWRMAWDYVKAKKHKVCPNLTFYDPRYDTESMGDK